MTETVEELKAEVARLRTELEAKTRTLELLFDNNPDGVAIFDATGKLETNAVATEIFGVSGYESTDIAPDDWVAFGIFANDGLTPAKTEELPLMRAVMGATVNDELLFVRNSFRPKGVWISVTARPIASGGAIAVIRDVTDRKRLEDDLATRNAELAASAGENAQLVERLRAAVDELSIPVLEVWRDVLAIPVIGVIDTQRSVRMSERVLSEVVRRRARYVIVDLTGVEVVDTATADQLVKLALAIRLLGSECLVTGIQPAVGQALVQLGVELRGFRSLPSLRRAIERCMQLDIDEDDDS